MNDLYNVFTFQFTFQNEYLLSQAELKLISTITLHIISCYNYVYLSSLYWINLVAIEVIC